MALNDVIARLLQMLGLKKSQADKYAAMEKKLRAKKASNVDRLEGLKEQIAALENKARQKKKEYDAATGDTKRIIGGEIERIFTELDNTRNRESIIGSNINTVSMAISKTQELVDAQTRGVEQDDLDELAVELEDIIGEMKDTDRAAEDLERVKYREPEKKSIDIEDRMEQLEGAIESEKKDQETLSESSAQRLRELAEEDE